MCRSPDWPAWPMHSGFAGSWCYRESEEAPLSFLQWSWGMAMRMLKKETVSEKTPRRLFSTNSCNRPGGTPVGLNSIAMSHWAGLRCAAQRSIRKRGLTLLRLVTLQQGGPDKIVYGEKKHFLMFPDVLSQTYRAGEKKKKMLISPVSSEGVD